MIREPKRDYRIAILLAFLVVICCVPIAGANDSNGMVALDNATGISGNNTVAESPTLTTVISPAPATIVETTPVETTLGETQMIPSNESLCSECTGTTALTSSKAQSFATNTLETMSSTSAGSPVPLSCSPNVGNAPLTVLCTDAIPICPPITHRYWEISDGRTFGEKPGTGCYPCQDGGSTIQVTFDTPGMYSVKFQRGDQCQGMGAVLGINVLAPTPTPTPTPKPYQKPIVQSVQTPSWIPVMEQPYTIKITVKNPNEDDIYVKLISDEALQPIPGKCMDCVKDTPSYIGQTHQELPETAESIPGTNKVPGGGTKEFTFNYGHDWHWLYSLESPNAGLMLLFRAVPFTNSALTILTGGGIGGAPILGFIPILSTAADAVPQMQYTYAISSTHELDWGGYPNNYHVTVDTKYEKKAAIFVAWSEGGTAAGFTGIGTIVAIGGGPAGWVGGAGLWTIEALTFIQAAEDMKHAIDPDMNYKEIVIKKKIIIPEMDEIPESPSKEAVWDTIRVLEDVTAYTDTMIKYDGASIANDTEWMIIHKGSGAMYARQAASDKARQRESMKIMLNEIKALNISITDEKIENAKNEIAQNGLPEIEVKILKRFGYNDDEIKHLANSTVSTMDPDYIKQYDTSFLFSNEIAEKTYENVSIMLARDVSENTAQANFKIEPSVIYSSSNDPWVTAYIGVPGKNVNQINISTVKINGIPAINDTSYDFVTNPEITDVNSDGYLELKVVFNKSEVQRVLIRGENDVVFTGLISDLYFFGNAPLSYVAPTPPVAYFHANTTYGNKPLIVEFTDVSLDTPTSWLWTFGDGTTSSEKNPVHVYGNSGNYSVTLKVTNADGSDTRSKFNFITVISTPTPPVANFTATNTTGKVPLTVQFNDTTTNAPTGWSWNFGDSTTATKQNPLHTYTAAGNYTVSLTATNPDGSNTKTMTDLITVLPLTPPIPNFTATPRSGRVPLRVVFNDTSSGGLPTLWYWTFGDGADAAGPNAVHTYTAPGNYTVVLEVANEDGDVFETRPDYIQVLPVPTPVADFSANTTSGKAPLVVKFTDRSTNEPTSWAWTFGDGYVSTEQNPVHQYDVSGIYTVNLTAFNAGGNTTKTITNYITVTKPSDPNALIDQLIVYIQNQNNLPKILQRLMVGELNDVKYSLQNNHPDDAVMGMKLFKLTVSLFKGWPLTGAQAATMQNSADAIIKEINLPVNQAAIDQTKSLSADVKNLKLSSSVETPLQLELEGTLFNLEIAKDQAAIAHLNIFISSVKAQDGKKIPHDKAVQLVTKAQGIITTIKP